MKRNIGNSADDIGYVASLNNSRERVYCAYNTNSLDVLEMLGYDPYPEVREAVAYQELTPPKVLHDLMNDQNIDVATVAVIMATSRHLFSDQERLARARYCFDCWCADGWDHGGDSYYDELLGCIVANPATPLEEVSQMMSNFYVDDVAYWALTRSDITPVLISDMYYSGVRLSTEVLERIAKHPNTPTDILLDIAQDPNEPGAQRLAMQNPNYVPPEV